MLQQYNPLQQNPMYTTKPRVDASLLKRRCTEEGDTAACNELLQGKVGFSAGYAEGGEVVPSLLSPDEGMTDYNDPLSGEDPLLPLADVLGEEGYMELTEAMVAYPIVADVAHMAIKTSDGMVEGMGGPTDDVVPARLSDGEFIFSAEAVKVLGEDKLEQIHEAAKQQAASA